MSSVFSAAYSVLNLARGDFAVMIGVERGQHGMQTHERQASELEKLRVHSGFDPRADGRIVCKTLTAFCRSQLAVVVPV